MSIPKSRPCLFQEIPPYARNWLKMIQFDFQQISAIITLEAQKNIMVEYYAKKTCFFLP